MDMDEAMKHVKKGKEKGTVHLLTDLKIACLHL